MNLPEGRITQKYLEDLSYIIIGCAIEVHKFLGPGLLESVYKKCFLRELTLRGIGWKAEQDVPLNYKGLYMDADLRYDVLVEGLIIVELKSVEGVLPVHQAILLTYMRMLEKPKGIMINFNCINIFKEGQKSFVNDIFRNVPKT